MGHMLNAALALSLLFPGAALAMPQVFATGTTVYNPEKAFNGFTVLAGGRRVWWT